MSTERVKNRNDIFGYNPKTRNLIYTSQGFLAGVIVVVAISVIPLSQGMQVAASFALFGGVAFVTMIAEATVARAKARVVEFDKERQVVRLVSFWYPTHFFDLRFYRSIEIPFDQIQDVDRIFFTRHRTERVLTTTSRFYLDARTDRLDRCVDRLRQIAVNNSVQVGQKPRKIISMTMVLFLSWAVVMVCAFAYFILISII